MTLNDRLAAYFMERPGAMVNARDLLPIAGFAGWRTRLSELRHPPYNMDIRNVPGTFRASDGQVYRTSHYVYHPPAVNQVSPDPWSLTAQERA